MPHRLHKETPQLVAAFEKRLGNDKIELLSTADCLYASGSKVDFEVVRYIAHRIVGSARLFGCEDLTKPALDVQRLVENGADTDVVIQAVKKLADLIDRKLVEGIPGPDLSGLKLH
ncbi:hypothetical protein FMN50_04360 [Rhodobacterales bacterium]|nr:hypothetical protein FMN50_04360 [Rhodobacterales bacterium]